MNKLTFPVDHLKDGRRKYLRDFISTWISWAEADGPSHLGFGVPFHSSHGLCLAANVWDSWHGSVPYLPGSCMGVAEGLIASIFEGQFAREEITSCAFPFNLSVNEHGSADGKGYFSESQEMICHLNPKRLEWARGLLAALDSEVAT